MSVFGLTRFRGASLGARAVRSSLWSTGAFAASQLLRLGSNLILTRLLFPEAFGLMALVAVIIQGLTNFSDTGVMQAVMSHKRGEDPRFLNTAFTIQAIRGVLLWVFACLLAWPLSLFYNAPQLIQILPAAALSLIVMGVNPMRVATAHRHLLLGRVSLLDILSQTLGVLIAIALAWWMQSVWALVISGVLAAIINVAFNWAFLPGHPDRLQWDRAAARELTSFGKWIFLSTIAGFFVSQGDRILIGRFLSLGAFGVYNIGYFLASFPNMLGRMVAGKVLIPIYREAPPGESRANFLKLRRMRMVVTATLLAIIAVLGMAGLWLVELLYDERYRDAGPVIVLLAVMWIPQIIALTYDQAALAVGDSRNFFVLALFRAVTLLGCVYLGLEMAGLLGAIIGQGMAGLLSYPVVVWLSRKSGAWDPLHDALFAMLGLAVTAVLFTAHRADIVALAAGAL
ncbi:Membrane protein involved in the export of O-antigen and teichoic acid [Roseivivax lentus]|uniref:Membrane protein involved in the export of O-antigen and teichoic acid n=1 Tax=Roseivivax lentus TaxID=633194 RepID=A0A1N7JVU7_9RHOB|nr:oligosaccharide flippase family protein [Roseivivax lentus]SIS53437.1 Membrane protein involved in the export of O-antigen and teichoic acid [Roseivivax lentus]